MQENRGQSKSEASQPTSVDKRENEAALSQTASSMKVELHTVQLQRNLEAEPLFESKV